MPPSTIPIVYEDRQLLICVKPAGILAEAAQGRGLPDLLQAQYRSGGKPDFIAGVHRLDRNVGGLMVFSRRPEVTGKLTAQIAQHEMRKEYLAEMRASFKAQLDSTYVQTADGAKIPYAEYARTAKEAANDIQAEHAGQGSANTPKS